MQKSRLSAVLFIVSLFAADALAQDSRPIPYPVYSSNAFQAAVEAGTRTTDGRPGPNYWTNYAAYTIRAELDPSTRLLRGESQIRYDNRSPHRLDMIYVHLYQNLHAEGAIRNRPLQVTGGVNIRSVAANGQQLVEQSARPGYLVAGTVMSVRLAEPLEPGASVELAIDWQFEVPRSGAPRMGHDGQVFYLGYWYPQIAVFDDVEGWVADQYQGNGEFYMGFADYDVRLTVPEGWLVSATGDLVNAPDVYSDTITERLAALRQPGDEVRVVEENERGRLLRPGTDGTLTWHFRAENVRDFAFGTSDAYIWDAALASTGEGTAYIHAFYRPERTVWQNAAEYGRWSVEQLSERFAPYPWPHMSIVEGIIGGGMEYPMITLIGGNRTEPSLFGVTYHEIAHMWFPMIVNQDEKRFTWMDEGLTSFNTTDAMVQYWNDADAWSPNRQYYYHLAGTDIEVHSMRHADEYPIGTPARVVAAYGKPAVVFHALRGIVGAERFEAAYQAYFDRWAYRHPYPWDLFNTFNDALGEDLDWFWRTMIYETWTHDLAIADVREDADRVVVEIEDRGWAPMPADVRITYDDGMTIEQRIPVDVWLEGETSITLEFAGGRVAAVEIDPERFLPDVDRTNNVWTSAVEPTLGE
jgi:hypothetical protein